MVQNITFFENEAELNELTKLNHDELWDQGFDLDDWDWGFVTNENYTYEVITEYGDIELQVDYDKTPSYIYSILNYMDNCCCGFRCVKYKDKFYYMLYHA